MNLKVWAETGEKANKREHEHLLQSICHPAISAHDGFLVNGKRAGATDWLLWHVQAFS